MMLLTKIEEESLEKWILSMDARGIAQTPDGIRKMANYLLAVRGTEKDLKVGINWVNRYLKRHPKFSTTYSRRFDYQRAKCQEPEIIRKWFDSVRETIIQYGIDPDDVYNVDETGFSMGLNATRKVVTGSEIRGHRQVIQDGNREWVTAIECINASGLVLQPFIIFKGKQICESWLAQLDDNWRVGVSENGWTSNDIAIRWLEKMFIPQTTYLTKGTHRLLILDGHGSHLPRGLTKFALKIELFLSICLRILLTSCSLLMSVVLGH